MSLYLIALPSFTGWFQVQFVPRDEQLEDFNMREIREKTGIMFTVTLMLTL